MTRKEAGPAPCNIDLIGQLRVVGNQCTFGSNLAQNSLILSLAGVSF